MRKPSRSAWAVLIATFTLMLVTVVLSVTSVTVHADDGVRFHPRLGPVEEPVLAPPAAQPVSSSGGGVTGAGPLNRFASWLGLLASLGVAGAAAVTFAGLAAREPVLQSIGATIYGWRNSFAWGVVKGIGKAALGVILALAVVAGVIFLSALSPLLGLICTIGVVGLVLYGIGAAFSRRWQEQKAAGVKPQFWATLGTSLLDTSGLSGVIEGIERRRMLTGEQLQPEAAGESVGSGVVQTLAWFVGAKWFRGGVGKTAVGVSNLEGKATAGELSELVSVLRSIGIRKQTLQRWASSATKLQPLNEVVSKLKAAGADAVSMKTLGRLLNDSGVMAELARLGRLAGVKGDRMAMTCGYLIRLLDMEVRDVAQYGSLKTVLEGAGIATPADRMLLRVSAQTQRLSVPQYLALSAVKTRVMNTLAEAEASLETLSSFRNYQNADILRLAYLERIAREEMSGTAGVAEKFEKGIVKILTRFGLNSAGDRAALKALPFENLTRNQKGALVAVRRYWELQLKLVLRRDGVVKMHREIPAEYVDGMLNAKAKFNVAEVDKGTYFTMKDAVSAISGRVDAFDQMALGYPTTHFSKGVGDRFFIETTMGKKLAERLAVPLTDEAAQLSRLLAGKPGLFPNTGAGVTASIRSFIPEWVWNGTGRMYEDGTILWKQTADGLLKEYAVVVKGRWEFWPGN